MMRSQMIARLVRTFAEAADALAIVPALDKCLERRKRKSRKL